MGCDIHAYIEFKHYDKWVEWTSESIWLERDYLMFGTLAGVPRTEVAHFIPPKGMPEDVSRAIRKQQEMWAGDGHTHSWLSTNEYLAAMYDYIHNQMNIAIKGEGGYPGIIHQPSQTYRALGSALAGLGEDARVVFWFDN